MQILTNNYADKLEGQKIIDVHLEKCKQTAKT
jgi:hypothetical protein